MTLQQMIHVLLLPTHEVWGKVMFFLGFCLSAREAWLPRMHHRSHDQGGLHPGGSASGGSAPGVCLHEGLHPEGSLHLGELGRPPKSAYRRFCIQGGLGRHPQDTFHTTRYGQQAGGTLPTGMQSDCSQLCMRFRVNWFYFLTTLTFMSGCQSNALLK